MKRSIGSGSLLALAVLTAALAAGAASAQPREEHPAREQQHYDARFHHNRAYPARGVYLTALPHEHFEVVRGGVHYYFAGGVWYAPRGVGFVVIGPPVGVLVPVLPPLYTTVWVGGLPYYYANDAYYAYRGPAQGYEVIPPPDPSTVAMQPPPPGDGIAATPDPYAGGVQPPPDAGAAPPVGADPPSTGTAPPSTGTGPPSTGTGPPATGMGLPATSMTAPAAPALPAGSNVFIYPRNGQSPDQQARDNYECHAWASGQTGFDPTAAGGGVPVSQLAARRADYNRAKAACLEGRGYTVR
jgi:hypothetical protein